VLFYIFSVSFYVFFVLFYVLFVFLCTLLFVCICVLNYCHRVATQLQLNISYIVYHHIIYRIIYQISYPIALNRIVSYHIISYISYVSYRISYHIEDSSSSVTTVHRSIKYVICTVTVIIGLGPQDSIFTSLLAMLLPDLIRWIQKAAFYQKK
jgi:hypothetical protein